MRIAVRAALDNRFPSSSDAILYYNTSISTENKNKTLEKFNTNKQVFAIVVNFKSASVALNVQQATVAIIIKLSYKRDKFT